MTAHPELAPGAFVLGGGPVGCLLIHGFASSPPEMRPLGDFLHQRGITVSAPLLPGHGTVPEDLNRTLWQDWAACSVAPQASAGLLPVATPAVLLARRSVSTAFDSARGWIPQRIVPYICR